MSAAFAQPAATGFFTGLDGRHALAVADGIPAATAAWARSGLMALSGPRHGAPVVPLFDAMAPIRELLEGVVDRTGALGRRVTLDERCLTERAVLQGLARAGQVSCNGTCRLIETRDGWVAVNLPRPIDLEAVPALVGGPASDEPWSALARGARRRDSQDLAESGQLLGLAVARVPAVAEDLRERVNIGSDHALTASIRYAPPQPGRTRFADTPPIVIDFSALWAGPLCTHILEAAGARVIKVESVTRPDSVRESSPRMFDLLHAGKESVALDFTAADDRALLRALLVRADLVVSSARPRAFEQLGLAPCDIIELNPALTWIAITAHGWAGPAGQCIGFGDDAAAAGGLLGWSDDGRPVFLGDALADPLTGLAAASAAMDGWAGGGGTLVDINLRGVARWVAAARALQNSERGQVMLNDNGQWQLAAAGRPVEIAEPRSRQATKPATDFGADTHKVVREFTRTSTNRSRKRTGTS